MRKCAVVAVGVLVAALFNATASGATRTAALIPAPGTGHGVLTGDPPANPNESLAYRPGVGGACDAQPRTFYVTQAYSGTYEEGPWLVQVGLPVELCVGAFPKGAVDVTIEPPSGRAIVVPRQAFDTSELALHFYVLPSPPRVRYEVSRPRGSLVASPIASGPLRGDGSGVYRARVSGGGLERVKSFRLGPAPSPQILNLNATEGLMVDRGTRLRFGVRGLPPLEVSHVGIFGPEDDAKRIASPLRTSIAARANERGEAIVTLDVAESAASGTFFAALEPYVRTKMSGSEPTLAPFEVDRRIARNGLPYTLIADTELRAKPTSKSRSRGVIPASTEVIVECIVIDGELLSDPVRGYNSAWDRVTWKGDVGYVADLYVARDVRADPRVPDCRSS